MASRSAASNVASPFAIAVLPCTGVIWPSAVADAGVHYGSRPDPAGEVATRRPQYQVRVQPPARGRDGILTFNPTSNRFKGGVACSWRSVSTSRNGTVGATLARVVSTSSVASSPQWRSSKPTINGRSAAIVVNSRMTAWTKRRRYASGASARRWRGARLYAFASRAARAAHQRGTESPRVMHSQLCRHVHVKGSDATGQAGKRMASDRTQSTTPWSTLHPSWTSRPNNSVINRVLPMPASPSTRRTPPPPARDASSARSSCWSSPYLPTIGEVPTAEITQRPYLPGPCRAACHGQTCPARDHATHVSGELGGLGIVGQGIAGFKQRLAVDAVVDGLGGRGHLSDKASTRDWPAALAGLTRC